MCGIFGYISRDSADGLLENMGSLLHHRGPDDVGYYSDEQNFTHFGLRRLSIIDIKGGHQPISNEEGTVWVACNGEIFNYIELRQDLIEKGHHFKTRSDVEVLVHLYEEYQTEFLEQVNGMYGLCLYDSLKKRLILARDRLGVKPLYYSYDGRRMAFASEIKPIFQCPWVGREPDFSALSSYLHLLYIPSPETGFSSVKKLPSASMGIYENGLFKIHRYWRAEDYLKRTTKDSNEAKNSSLKLRELLFDSCRLQMRSDVPVGAFLSGGVDSSAVVALANSKKKRSMDTYTIAWQNATEKMDERPFAKSVADRYGCRHHEMQISWQDFDRLLPLLVWHLEEPNADGAFVPTYLISKFAQKRSKVILTGAGGDELFGGYGFYLPEKGLLKHLRQNAFELFLPSLKPTYTKRAFNFPWQLIFKEYRSGRAKEFLKPYCNAHAGIDLLNTEMVFDLEVYLQDNILALTDKMSMAASIEARVPLIDHRIVEYALGLPSSEKIRDTSTKVIMKDAVSDLLPDTILNRRKDGFGAPVTSWMNGKLRKIAIDVIGNGYLIKEGVIDRKSLSRLDWMIKCRKSWNWALWILLNLELWYRFVLLPTDRPDGIRLSDI